MVFPKSELWYKSEAIFGVGRRKFSNEAMFHVERRGGYGKVCRKSTPDLELGIGIRLPVPGAC